MPTINAIHRSSLTPCAVMDPTKLTPPGEYLLHPDPAVVEAVPRKYWKVDGDVLREMTTQEKEATDAGLLPQARRAKVAAIVARTPLVMAAAGFPYGGKRFRMDADGVAWYHLLFAARASLAYPVVLPTKDGDGFEAIAGAAEMQAFGAALVAELNARIAEELAILQQVKDAATLAQVEAVVDPR